MGTVISYNLDQLRDFATLFSRREVLSWLKMDFSSIDFNIERYNSTLPISENTTYLQYLKKVYRVLENHYQNEYIIKNSFLNEWLIKELGSNNSIVFNEFRVGNAKADLVMFNGVSRAFEIKTEYDSDQRLDFQLNNYQKAFNEIYLIIPESKLSIYEKYDKDIGMVTYGTQATDKFTLLREAKKVAKVDSRTLMHILHTPEYKRVVAEHYGELPAMTSFNQFRICSELINRIPSAELNEYFVNIMKLREMENTFSTRYFREFNQLFLALKMKKVTRKNLLENLKTPLKS